MSKPWKGKGSWTRVSDLDRYVANYDDIFRKKQAEKRCRFCGSFVYHLAVNCPSCMVPLEYIEKP